jgi:hypothetical protein
MTARPPPRRHSGGGRLRPQRALQQPRLEATTARASALAVLPSHLSVQVLDRCMPFRGHDQRCIFDTLRVPARVQSADTHARSHIRTHSSGGGGDSSSSGGGGGGGGGGGSGSGSSSGSSSSSDSSSSSGATAAVRGAGRGGLRLRTLWTTSRRLSPSPSAPPCERSAGPATDRIAPPRYASPGGWAAHNKEGEQKRASFLTSALCLSRACLGRVIIFSIGWCKRGPFSYLLRLPQHDLIADSLRHHRPAG